MGQLHQKFGGRQARRAVELPGGAALVAMHAIDYPIRLLLGAADPPADAGQVVLVGQSLDRKLLAKQELIFQKVDLCTGVRLLLQPPETKGAPGVVRLQVAQLPPGLARASKTSRST